MENYKCTHPIYPETEDEVTYKYNHNYYPPCPHYIPDPTNIFDIKGNLVGFSWNYGDTVKLKFNLNNTILHSDDEHLELFKIYLSDKTLEINFSDVRGNVIYSFQTPAKLITELELDTNEDNLIERNTYKCELVLINTTAANSRTSLLLQPYDIYVK